MFDHFRGLPLHPLVVHAAVVLLPVVALLGVLFILPRWRARLRWPLLVGTLASLLVVYVARESGFALRSELRLNDNPLVQQHLDLATQLVLLLVAMAVVVGVAVVLTRPSRAAGGTTATTVVAVLVLLVSVAVGVQTARVGEAGSRALWGSVPG